MNYSQMLDQVKQFTFEYFKKHSDRELVYHNLTHTEAVASNAMTIASHYQLTDRDFFIVVSAAWLHDAGYLDAEPSTHEQRGAEIAAECLERINADPDTIRQIQNCILATRMPQDPKNLNEQIVCDADLFHFGTDHFRERNKLMRREAEKKLGRKISGDEWRNSTIRFMEAHHYHTSYGRNLLQQRKEANLEALKAKASSQEKSKSQVKTTELTVPNAVVTQAGFKKPKPDRPERGIETMFRVSSNNHQRLSDMADNKAHIMITTTSIIISVLLSVLLRKLEDNPHLIIPTLILLTVCVVTMVFCILATRPSLPEGTFTKADVDTRKVNLLFFGNYFKMSFDDYDAGMRQMMNDRDFLYGSLTRDLYSQGVVLGRKYRLLRKGYTVFMYGIVAAVIAFFVASVFFGD